MSDIDPELELACQEDLQTSFSLHDSMIRSMFFTSYFLPLSPRCLWVPGSMSTLNLSDNACVRIQEGLSTYLNAGETRSPIPD